MNERFSRAMRATRLATRAATMIRGSIVFSVASFLIFCTLLFASSVAAMGADTGSENRAGDKRDRDKAVVIEEYMSLTCSHCAVFHRKIYPELSRSVLLSEHVSFRYRDFPLDRVALSAAILSRCGGASLRGKLVGAIMDRQDRLLSSPEPMSIIFGILQLVGIDEARARACLSDKSLERAVLEEQLDGKRRYDISSTPTIVVAGEKITGRLSSKNIIAAVNEALRRAGLPSTIAPASQ